MIRKKSKVKVLALAVTCAILAGGYSVEPVYAANLLYKSNSSSGVYTADADNRSKLTSLRLGDITINDSDNLSINSVGSDGTGAGTISINGFNFDYDDSKQITFTGSGIKIGSDTTVNYTDLSGVVNKTQKISYDDDHGTIVDGKLSLKDAKGNYSSVNDAVAKVSGIKADTNGYGLGYVYHRTIIEGLSIDNDSDNEDQNNGTIALYTGKWSNKSGVNNAAIKIYRLSDGNSEAEIPNLTVTNIKGYTNEGTRDSMTFAQLKSSVDNTKKISYISTSGLEGYTMVDGELKINGNSGAKAGLTLIDNDTSGTSITVTAEKLATWNDAIQKNANGETIIGGKLSGKDGSKVGGVTFDDYNVSDVDTLEVARIKDRDSGKSVSAKKIIDTVDKTKNISIVQDKYVTSSEATQIDGITVAGGVRLADGKVKGKSVVVEDSTGNNQASLSYDGLTKLNNLVSGSSTSTSTVIKVGDGSQIGGVNFTDSKLENVKIITNGYSGYDIVISNDVGTNTTTIESTLSVSEKIAAGNYGNLAINAGEANQVKIGKNGIAVGKNSSHMDAENGFYTDKNLYVGSGHVYDDATSTLTKAPTEENSKFFVDGTDGHLKAAGGNFTVDADGNIVSKGTLKTTGNISTDGDLTVKGGINAAGGKFQVDGMNGRVYANAGLTVNGDLQADSAFIGGRVKITDTGDIKGVNSISTGSLTTNSLTVNGALSTTGNIAGENITGKSLTVTGAINGKDIIGESMKVSGAVEGATINGAQITYNSFNGATITSEGFNGVTLKDADIIGRNARLTGNLEVNGTINGAKITSNSFNGVTMNNGDVTGKSFTSGSSSLKDGELKLNDANTWTTADGLKAEKASINGVTIGESKGKAIFDDGDTKTTIEGGVITTATLNVRDIVLGGDMYDDAGHKLNGNLSIGSDGHLRAANGNFDVKTDGSFTNNVGNTTLKTDANGAVLSYNGSVKSEVSVGDGKVNVSAGSGSIGIANGEIKSSVGSNASSTITADSIVDKVGNNSVTTDATGTTFNNGSGTTNINGNTITTGKLITDELVIKGGTPGSGGSLSIGGDGTIKSDVKDGSDHTTFETSKTGTTTVSEKDGAKTENKVEASGNTNTVTKGTAESKSTQTATSIGGVVTNGEVSMKQELTTNGLMISDEKGDAANYTQITNKDVSIADPNNAGKRINLSDLGKLGDLGDLKDEITSHEEYTKNSTAVGAINAEAKIRQEEVNRLDNRINDISGRINDVSNRVDKVGAMAAAIASLKTMGYDPQAPSEFSVGLGHYKGETGVALGFFHYPNKNFMINVSLSTAGGETMGGIGATWRFGHKSPQKLLDEQRAAQAKHF